MDTTTNRYPSRAERIAAWVDQMGPTLRLRCRSRRKCQCQGRARRRLAEMTLYPVYRYLGPTVTEMEEPR